MNQPATAKKAPRKVSRRTSQHIVAGIVVLTIVVGVGLMLYATQGWMNQGYGIAFFVATALVAGITFWTLTPSPDDSDIVHWKWLGVRLGGGAAIGLVFAYVAWNLVPSDDGYVVVQIPSTVGTEGLTAWTDDGVRFVELLDDRRSLLVELMPRNPTGRVRLRWLDENEKEIEQHLLIEVDRFSTVVEVNHAN